MQKKTVIMFRIQSSSLVLHIHTHAHTQWSWKFLYATLRYAENKCCPLISRNSHLAHVIPLH